MEIIFGPIPSRRFGMSLGVDLSPAIKQCNFDCLYCELSYAKTVSKQLDIVPVSKIVDQLKIALVKHKNIDVITFTANGEPTLYPNLSELIDEVDKIKGDIKTLILSNGANIYDKNIQTTLSKIDIVKLSLDCVSQKCFKKLDRIDNSVDCTKIVNGMIEFRKIYKKQLILEILFVKSLNDNQSEIELLIDAVKKISPNRIDLNTIDRPPAYNVEGISYNNMVKIADKFKNLPVTIAHKNKIKNQQNYTTNEILSLLKLRPLTQDDIENIFDNQTINRVQQLLNLGKIDLVDNNGIKFYKIL